MDIIPDPFDPDTEDVRVQIDIDKLDESIRKIKEESRAKPLEICIPKEDVSKRKLEQLTKALKQRKRMVESIGPVTFYDFVTDLKITKDSDWTDLRDGLEDFFDAFPRILLELSIDESVSVDVVDDVLKMTRCEALVFRCDSEAKGSLAKSRRKFRQALDTIFTKENNVKALRCVFEEKEEEAGFATYFFDTLAIYPEKLTVLDFEVSAAPEPMWEPFFDYIAQTTTLKRLVMGYPWNRAELPKKMVHDEEVEIIDPKESETSNSTSFIYNEAFWTKLASQEFLDAIEQNQSLNDFRNIIMCRHTNGDHLACVVLNLGDERSTYLPSIMKAIMNRGKGDLIFEDDRKRAAVPTPTGRKKQRSRVHIVEGSSEGESSPAQARPVVERQQKNIQKKDAKSDSGDRQDDLAVGSWRPMQPPRSKFVYRGPPQKCLDIPGDWPPSWEELVYFPENSDKRRIFYDTEAPVDFRHRFRNVAQAKRYLLYLREHPGEYQEAFKVAQGRS